MLHPGAEIRSDHALLEQTREGNQEAFGELITRHYRTCFHIASFILRDRGDAEDAVQDAMWRAFTHLEQYRQEAPFRSWLTQIVVNYSLMHLRRRKREKLVACELESGPYRRPLVQLLERRPDPEQNIMEQQHHEILMREIHHLPPLFRNVLLMHDMFELPLAEISERLQITLSAVKGRLVRARKELKKRVTEGYIQSRSTLECNPPEVRRTQKNPAGLRAANNCKPPATRNAAELESPANRPIAEKLDRKNSARRYDYEIPFDSVWINLREQLASGARREVQL